MATMMALSPIVMSGTRNIAAASAKRHGSLYQKPQRTFRKYSSVQRDPP